MRGYLTAVAALAAMTITLAPANAAATVHVKLTDKGGMMDMSKDMKMGMGMHANMKMAMMGIAIDKKAVPAGKVTFDVKNTSSETVHEMLVAPIASLEATMPFKAAENRVDEEAARDLGEVSELDPGKGGSLTLDLKPGLYILYCNIPGHFGAGMWTTLQVK
jgi:uncharacterized cupredoxin-like copper-binding protein